MISVSYDITVPGFSMKEIGYATLVRSYDTKVKFNVTNDRRVTLRKLSARAVLESYVGQDKPLLFSWAKPQVIKEIPPEDTVSIEFEFSPTFPGLVSVALYVTDAGNKTIKAKRKTSSNYEQAPVRWWFHVIDDISLEILMALRQLVAKE
jgi:hypothetical protein